MYKEFFAIVIQPYFATNFEIGTITKVKINHNGVLTHVFFPYKILWHKLSQPSGWNLNQFELFPIDNKLLKLLYDGNIDV